MEDAFNHVLQWDNRIFVTLKQLFFMPGKLSLHWVEGKRMRYVPPFRLYIIASFILFLLVGIATQGGTVGIQNADLETTKVTEDIQKAEQDAQAKGEWFSAALLAGASEVVQDPSEYMRKIVSNLPKAAFLLLPVFALLHMAVEFRKDRYYIDYLVFSLHFHAFTFLLLALILIVGFIYKPAGELAQLLNLCVPVYAVVGVRRFNPQSWIKSCFKGVLIFCAYGIILGIGIAAYFTLLLLI